MVGIPPFQNVKNEKHKIKQQKDLQCQKKKKWQTLRRIYIYIVNNNFLK